MKKDRTAVWLLALLFLLSRCADKQDPTITISTQPDPAKEKDTLAFGDKNWIGHGLEGKIYYLPDNTSNLSFSFDTMKVQGTIYTKTLDVPNRSWSVGFPGVGNRFEWFAIVYKGTFSAKKAGQYTFRLSSDDGAKLYIDDSLVINNDGEHPVSSREGTMNLDRADHRITVQYFQGPRFYVALQLFAHLDKEDEQVFPGNYFTVSTPAGCRWGWWIFWIVLAIVLLTVLLFRTRKRRPISRTAEL